MSSPDRGPRVPHLDIAGRPVSLQMRAAAATMPIQRWLDGRRNDFAAVHFKDVLGKVGANPLAIDLLFGRRNDVEEGATLYATGQDALLYEVPFAIDLLSHLPNPHVPPHIDPLVGIQLIDAVDHPERSMAHISQILRCFDLRGQEQRKPTPTPTPATAEPKPLPPTLEELFGDMGSKVFDTVANDISMQTAITGSLIPISASAVDVVQVLRGMSRQQAVEHSARVAGLLKHSGTVFGASPRKNIEGITRLNNAAAFIMRRGASTGMFPGVLARMGAKAEQLHEYTAPDTAGGPLSAKFDGLLKTHGFTPVRDPRSISLVLNNLMYSPPQGEAHLALGPMAMTALMTLHPHMQFVLAGLKSPFDLNGLFTDMDSMGKLAPTNAQKHSINNAKDIVRHGQSWRGKLMGDYWKKAFLSSYLRPLDPKDPRAADIAAVKPVGKMHANVARHSWTGIRQSAVELARLIAYKDGGNGELDKQLHNASSTVINAATNRSDFGADIYTMALMTHLSAVSCARRYATDSNSPKDLKNTAVSIDSYTSSIAQHVAHNLFAGEAPDYAAQSFIRGVHISRSSGALGWKPVDYKRAYTLLTHMVAEAPQTAGIVAKSIGSIFGDSGGPGSGVPPDIHALAFLDKLISDAPEKSPMQGTCSDIVYNLAEDIVVYNIAKSGKADVRHKDNGFTDQDEYWNYNGKMFAYAVQILAAKKDQRAVDLLRTLRNKLTSSAASTTSTAGNTALETRFIEALEVLGDLIVAKFEGGDIHQISANTDSVEQKSPKYSQEFISAVGDIKEATLKLRTPDEPTTGPARTTR